MSLENYLHAGKNTKNGQIWAWSDTWTWQGSNQAKWPHGHRHIGGACPPKCLCHVTDTWEITSPWLVHHPSLSVWSKEENGCAMDPWAYHHTPKTMKTAIPTSIWASTEFITIIGVHPRLLDSKMVDPPIPTRVSSLPSTDLQHIYKCPFSLVLLIHFHPPISIHDQLQASH